MGFILNEYELKTSANDVLNDVVRFAKTTSWGPVHQICYTSPHPTDRPNDVFIGAGSLRWYVDRQSDGSFIKRERERRVRETEFVHFNKAYENTHIHRLYKEIQEVAQLPVLRMRAMTMMPGCCLTMHHDGEPRAHLALKTNEDCFFVVEHSEVHHIPLNNKLVVVDTTKTHTFVNASVDNRFHIVCGLNTYTS